MKCKMCKNYHYGRGTVECDFCDPPFEDRGAVDWKKVKKDSKVMVKSDNGFWHNRHFAGMKDGIPFVYAGGGTSWTTTEIETWKYTRYKEEE